MIIKSGGEQVPYDREKVKRSILRTKAGEAIAEEVLAKVEPQMFDGITTKELYALVHNALKNKDICFSCRYDLRAAILRFGPAGFNFEKYVAAILKAYGWKTTVPEEDLQGSCVAHEVDVVAEKDSRRIFIEAKFRNKYNDVVNLKDTMATWSRFLDLVDGSAVGKCPHFDEAWIVTNARFSNRAKQFGVCKGIHMIGWNFPSDYPFNQMVDHLALYPLTVIDELKPSELEAFAEHGLLLCKEVAELEADDLSGRTGISESRVEQIIEICASIITEESGSEQS